MAVAHNNLGLTYHGRIHEDRADNLEQAIEFPENALTVWKRETAPLNADPGGPFTRPRYRAVCVGPRRAGGGGTGAPRPSTRFAARCRVAAHKAAPPAEAPMPTTGKSGSSRAAVGTAAVDTEGDGDCGDSSENEDSEGEGVMGRIVDGGRRGTPGQEYEKMTAQCGDAFHRGQISTRLFLLPLALALPEAFFRRTSLFREYVALFRL